MNQSNDHPQLMASFRAIPPKDKNGVVRSKKTTQGPRHIPGTTIVAGKCFVVATEAKPGIMPEGERYQTNGSADNGRPHNDHHFYRPQGDFVHVTARVDGHFSGRWVQAMTIQPGSNGIKLFPVRRARKLHQGEVERLMEILQVTNLQTTSHKTLLDLI